MTIKLNGKDHRLEKSISLPEFLKSLDMDRKPVVIELNKTAILPREYAKHTLKNGDLLEIVTLAAGG